MLSLAWLIPLFPLILFFILILNRNKLNQAAPYLAIGTTILSFLASLWVLIQLFQSGPTTETISWFSIGTIEITAGISINQLNGIMLIIVSFISLLVQIYSISYMGGDSRLSTYYAYLSLFTASMLGLVVSPNLLQIYFFWELVGLGSFLLIGFYFTKETAKQAAKKAFIMTRIGDVGLLIGILLLFHQTQTFEIQGIFQAIQTGNIENSMLTLIAILIFIGAIGKSAQFPLHTWLPDAMEGPTPISALIHAATMVAAGVYLVAALYPLFIASPVALTTIATIGGITAFLAATIALTQKDIKRVLAYSTVSQLGFMMMALGTLGYTAAIFHLTTHAFFKALLFLAAGSVIHSVGTQNMNEMGGLRKKLPLTHAVFLIGTLSISGLPLLSGFFSKDEILIAIFTSGNQALFVAAIITAFLTACYMFRLYFSVFIKRPAIKHTKLHDAPKPMLVPMVILAVFSVGIGYLNTHWFGTFLGDWLMEGQSFAAPDAHGTGWIVWVAILTSVAGLVTAYLLTVKNKTGDSWLESRAPYTYQTLQKGYYLDELYQLVIVKGAQLISHIIQFIDKYIIGTVVEVITGTISVVNHLGSKLQNGRTQVYGLVALVGFIILLALSLWTGGQF